MPIQILTSCSSVMCVLMVFGMFVHVMSSLMSVMIPLYVDLKYDDVFVLWLSVICEWLSDVFLVDVLLVMGCCVGCVLRCCYGLCGCVNGAYPVGFVLSFYLCAFQMNHCVLCVWLLLIEVCCLPVTNDWNGCWCVFVYVCRRTRI